MRKFIVVVVLISLAILSTCFVWFNAFAVGPIIALAVTYCAILERRHDLAINALKTAGQIQHNLQTQRLHQLQTALSELINHHKVLMKQVGKQNEELQRLRTKLPRHSEANNRVANRRTEEIERVGEDRPGTVSRVDRSNRPSTG